MRADQLAALVGTIAVAALMVVLVAMHLIQPGLGPVDHFVSEYAHGRFGWLVPTGYVLAGSGTLLMVWPLIARFGKGGWALASVACLIVIGAGLIGTGLTRIDVPGPDGVSISTSSGQLHELSSYLAVFGLVAGAFVIPATFRRDPLVSNGRPTLRLFKWLVLASLIIVLLGRPLGVVGLGQRLFLVVALSWLILVGIQLSGIDPVAVSNAPPRLDRSGPDLEGQWGR
jgi:hypothetical protein